MVSPFPRSTLTLSLSGDTNAAGLGLPVFPRGTIFYPEFQTPQGIIAGTIDFSSTPDNYLGTTTFYAMPSSGKSAWISWGDKGYISVNDINSSGAAVAMQYRSNPYAQNVYVSPALASPFESPSDPLYYVDLSKVVNEPGWNLMLQASSLSVPRMRIDDLGRIVGYGGDDGPLHAFLLTPSSLPSPNVVPEPASLALLGLLALSLLTFPACRRNRTLSYCATRSHPES